MLALVRCTAMAAIGKGKTNRYVSKDGLQRAKDGLWNRKDRSPRFGWPFPPSPIALPPLPFSPFYSFTSLLSPWG